MEEGQLTARKEVRHIRVRDRGGGETSSYSGKESEWKTKKEEKEKQRVRRQVHKLSGDEKTTEEQLNNATSPHSSIPYCPLLLLGV